MKTKGGVGYSVLMSVYWKEKPEFLRQSMDSIYSQTIPTDNFVLVCDGPLGEGLYKVVEEQKTKFQEALKIIQLERNCGLGNALNEGMKFCRHEWVARMDSDDISFPERCERQLSVFRDRPEIAICSGTVLEFRDTPDQITGKRALPEEHQDICMFSHRRNPFNHPAVMFRKLAVEEAGGYQEQYHLFEDYDLWVRMLMKGYQGYNLKTPLLYMRVPEDMYARRGGRSYAKTMLQFHWRMLQNRWSNGREYITGAVPHAMICVLPNRLRKQIYQRLHGHGEEKGIYESSDSYPVP